MEDYHQLIANTVAAHAERLGRAIDYIEVGVFRGESALAVLSTGHCRFAVLIDDFSNTHCGDAKSSLETVEKNLHDYGGLFEIKVGPSHQVLPLVKRRFDIGFVDGEHTVEGCRGDIERMFPLIREDGILFVDDMQHPAYMHIKGIAEQFASEKGLKLTYHEVHEGLGELRRQRTRSGRRSSYQPHFVLETG
jgi:predicted O-methyltransferase YrrM